jgi:steroid 5-alpha reductase family enzyme
MSSFNASLGKTIEIQVNEVGTAEGFKAVSEYRRDTFAQRLSVTIVGVVIVALAVATGIGVADGSYNEVQAVWSAVALYLGWVIRSYLPGKPD